MIYFERAKLCLFLIFILLFNLNANAKAVQKAERILVLGIKGKGLDSSVLNSLNAILVKEINSHPGYNAVSKDEVSKMLDAEALKQSIDCDSESCLLEIAGAFGAQKIISGNIGKTPGSLMVNLEIMNTARAIVESRVNYNWRGSISDLSELVKVAAQSLVLKKNEKKPAELVISRAKKEAMVFLDGEEKGTAKSKIGGISLGPHKLVLQLDGYKDFETYFLAKNGDTAIVEAPMEVIKEPFYEKWWFWTGTLVVIAGSITTLVLLKKEEPPQKITVEGEIPYFQTMPGGEL